MCALVKIRGLCACSDWSPDFYSGNGTCSLGSTRDLSEGTRNRRIKETRNFPAQGRQVFDRGGFRISSRVWQRYLQRVAKISQGVAENCAQSLFYTTLIIYINFFFDILDTCYKVMNKIYFEKNVLVRLLSFMRKFGSPQRPRFRGSLNPLKSHSSPSIHPIQT